MKETLLAVSDGLDKLDFGVWYTLKGTDFDILKVNHPVMFRFRLTDEHAGLPDDALLQQSTAVAYVAGLFRASCVSFSTQRVPDDEPELLDPDWKHIAAGYPTEDDLSETGHVLGVVRGAVAADLYSITDCRTILGARDYWAKVPYRYSPSRPIMMPADMEVAELTTTVVNAPNDSKNTVLKMMRTIVNIVTLMTEDDHSGLRKLEGTLQYQLAELEEDMHHEQTI